MQPCQRCHGIGSLVHSAFGSYPAKRAECPYCHGYGEYPDIDIPRVLADITLPAKAGSKRPIRKSSPPGDRRTVNGSRAYFVWRLARFHGGIDVTMPIMAEVAIEGDPYHKELDELAGRVAERVFGTQRAAAARWSGLLGIGNPAELRWGTAAGNLPATAYEGGPVLLDEKPDDELAELM